MVKNRLGYGQMAAQDEDLGRMFLLKICLPRAAILAALFGLAKVGAIPVFVLAALVIADGVYLVHQFRRFLHAGDRHVAAHGGTAPIWGGYLFFLIVGWLGIVLWWGVFLVALTPPETESYADQQARERAALYSLDADGTRLVLTGEITFGVKDEVARQLQAHPELRTLVLASEGGHIYEARGLAFLVRDHGLNTQVETVCSSACTLVFVAGQRRQLGAEARLGFHQYAVGQGGALPNLDPVAEQEKDRRFFAAQGANPAFLRRMFDTPSEGMWFVDAAEAATFGLTRMGE
jgi:hypothetical protein